MMKCLVTGGAGFIGSHLVDRLLSDGHEVIVIDNYSSDAHDIFYKNPNAKYHNLDITKLKWMKKIFKGVDIVFHLAAESRITNCIENPTLAVETNILGTCNVLQASLSGGVKRVLYSSTSAAYGLNTPPNKETDDEDCLNPYSVSKVAGEKLCKMYHDLYGLKTVIFRYFNVYGERQPVRGQYAPVVGLFQKQYSEGNPMTVVGDGLQKRDFIHVSDVVEANIILALSDNSNIFGKMFNIGTEINYSVLDLTNIIGGDSATVEYIPTRVGEVRETLSDCSQIFKYTDWKPKINLKEWIND